MKKRPGGGFNVFDFKREQAGGRGGPPPARGGTPIRRGGQGGNPKWVRLLIPSDTTLAIGGREFDARSWSREIENRTGGPVNRSLMFHRMAPLLDVGGAPLKGGAVGDVLFAIAGSPSDGGIAAALQTRMQRALDALVALGAQPVRIDCTQTSRLVSRLGEHHPYETGFMFHPLYGIPFLPGSGIKGAVRAALTRQLAEDADLAVPVDQSPKRPNQGPSNEASNLLRELFGSATKDEDSDRAGRVVALDAFPSSYELETDVLTPHFPKYYAKGQSAPTDDQGPKPVPFLSVKAEAKWSFRLALLRPRGGNGVENAFDRLCDAARSALEDWGLGAKKSSGYGSFRIVEFIR